jgi:hypothetical protein
VPSLEGEIAKDKEARVWREHLHALPSGEVFIPPTAFKNCLSEAAKYLGLSVPGKGKSTYTKHIEAGVLVVDPAPLGIMKDEVAGEWLFLPSDGIRGSGKRVMKCYPVIPSWSCTVRWHILDQIITDDVFLKHLEVAGSFIGIGRFRPRNNGFYGRFQAEISK